MSPAQRAESDAVQDLQAALEAYRAEVRSVVTRGREALTERRTTAMLVWQEQGFAPLVARHDRYIFALARRAYRERALLESDEHAELMTEYHRRKDTEDIPPEVVLYAEASMPRHRPRRTTMANRERKGRHFFFLLWGYYRRSTRRRPKRPDARDYAIQQTALIMSASKSTVKKWVEKPPRPPHW